MIGKITKQLVGAGILAIALGTLPVSAQKLSKAVGRVERVAGLPGDVKAVNSQPEQQFVAVDQPDAERTKNEFLDLLRRYPPTLRNVFRQDPSLLTQQQYLAPYPTLVNYLNAHPEIALNPTFYLGGLAGNTQVYDRSGRGYDAWNEIEKALEIFTGFGMAIGLLTWLIRTFLDYRRWNRLSKVQTEVHTRLLDRFSSNEELMAYIATPAGSKFLQSAPISLDTGVSSRAVGAPLSRILWSLQAGLVMVAGGSGLMLASGRMDQDTYLPLEIMGIIAVALGVGFAVSAAVSYMLSSKMGLLDAAPQKRPFRGSAAEPPEAQ